MIPPITGTLPSGRRYRVRMVPLPRGELGLRLLRIAASASLLPGHRPLAQQVADRRAADTAALAAPSTASLEADDLPVT